MKHTILFAALVAVVTLTIPNLFAEEAKAPKASAEQKVILLTAERDYLLAMQQAQQAQAAVQQTLADFQAKEAKVLKDVGADPERWDFNVNTMEFVAKPKPEPKPTEKPAEKK